MPDLSEYFAKLLAEPETTREAFLEKKRQWEEQKALVTQTLDAQFEELFANVTFDGEIGPAFGSEEVIPIENDTYERAVKVARSNCQHQPATQVEWTKWFCPSCKRVLDVNDLGIGGV